MEKTENKIGQDFTTFGLALFALPSFFTNLFAQLFKSLDDGLFVSRYVGETALASINILGPLAGFQMAFEHLFSLGASNISAKLMGEGKQQESKQVFSQICVTGFIFSCIFALLINVFSSQILTFLGADEQLQYYATYTIRTVYLIAPITLLNRTFNCYYSTAGKPKMGMYCSIINGVFNIGLDIVLIVILKMGVLGASIATMVGDIAVFVVGIIFFFNKKNEIHFVMPKSGYIDTTIQSAKYAFPQFLNSFSFSLTSYLSNIMILKLIGSTGIAANAVVGDVRSIITSGLIGFSICIVPVVSYNVGSKDIVRLKRILSHVLTIWFIGSIILTIAGLLLRRPLLLLFMSESTSDDFYNLAHYALTIEMFATPAVCGCITANRVFIALGNAKVAALSSIFRNLIIKSIMYVLLPTLIGESGIWLSLLVSENIALLFVVYLLYRNADNYGYGKSGVAYLIK